MAGERKTHTARLICTECDYIFSIGEMNAEHPDHWGHPCHGYTRPGVCESFRRPVTEQDKGKPVLVQRLRKTRASQSSKRRDRP